MDASTRFQFNLRTKVRFANGAFASVGKEAAALGRTALVVTGRRAMRRTGVTDRVVRQLEAEGVRPVLFEEATPNPTTAEVDAGAELALRERVEVVIGLGGGSAIDVAKAIAVAVTYRKPCQELLGVPLATPGLPVVAVPTTSGTGAEVTGVAVVTDSARRHKTALRSPFVAPAVAVVDPELTVTMPAEVTASSGMDALAHAVESYLSKNANPFTEVFAERATALILAHLRQACADGADLAARTGMALGSLMAGVTLAQAGVILGHAVGMALGGVFGTDHGATVGLLLPEVLEFSLPASAPRLARLARAAGVVPGGSESGKDEQVASAFIRLIRDLLADLPLPAALAEMGCHRTELPLTVERTMGQGAMMNNPQALSAAEVTAFLDKVLRQGTRAGER